MTASTRPTPAAEVATADLVERLVSVLDDRMTKAGHPAILVVQEHRGVCPPYECSLRCREYRALFVEATAWLAEHRPQETRQLALVEAT